MRVEDTRDQDAWLLTGACLAFLIVPVAFSFHFTSFLHAKELVLATLLILMSFFTKSTGARACPGFRLLMPLAVWLMVSLGFLLTVSPVSFIDGAVEASRLALMLVFALYLFCIQPSERLFLCLLSSTVLIALLGILQYAGSLSWLLPHFPGYTQPAYSVFGNQDLFGGYLALAWPALFLLSRQRAGWSAAALALVTGGLLVSGSRSAWLAAAGGTLVAVACQRDWSASRRINVLVVLVAVGTMILLPQATIHRVARTFDDRDEGFHARVVFWRAGVHMFLDKPLRGMGLGNYAYWSPEYVGDVVSRSGSPPLFDVERHATQPHSEPMRILAETGLAGALCWLWFLWRVLKGSHAGGTDVCAGWGILASLLIFGLFNGVLDSVPHMMAGFLALSMVHGRDDIQKAPKRVGARGLAVATLVVCLAEVCLVLMPSYLQRAADAAEPKSQRKLSLYERAAKYPVVTPEVYKHYGFALAEIGRDDEAIAALQMALQSRNTGDIYLTLSILALERRDCTAARKWANQCLRRWPGNADAQRVLGACAGLE